MATPRKLDLTRTDIGHVNPPMGTIRYEADNAFWDINGNFVGWQPGHDSFPNEAKIKDSDSTEVRKLKTRVVELESRLEARDNEVTALKEALANATPVPPAPGQTPEPNPEPARIAEQNANPPPNPDEKGPQQLTTDQDEIDKLTQPGGKKAPESLTTEEREALANDKNAAASKLQPGTDVTSRLKAWAAAGDDAKAADYGFAEFEDFKDAVEATFGERPRSKAEARQIINAEQ